MQYSECKRDCREGLQKQQAGMCAICGRTGKLVLDHDHETGEVRGFLCGPCNSGLGMFRDDTFMLTRAVLYLKKSKKQAEVARRRGDRRKPLPIEPTTQPWEDDEIAV